MSTPEQAEHSALRTFPSEDSSTPRRMVKDAGVHPAADEISLAGLPLGPRCPELIKPPLVSFILRNWNYADYVGSAIDSIKHQDYPRFEVIIVDNGSTDDSRDVIAQHIGDDPMFSVKYLERNYGPLGGALKGLDDAKGEFVTFVDSDDYLLPNFASLHVQAHLAAKRNVAFSSSNLLEITDDGSIITGQRAAIKKIWDKDENRHGLRHSLSVPRLGTVSEEDYDRLSQATFNYEPRDFGWFWSPGTANMYRRFLLEMLRPVGPADYVSKLAVDGHYNRLCHQFGGSMLIDQHLSAYRVHDTNFFTQAPSLSSMRNGGGSATDWIELRRGEAMRVLLNDPEQTAWRLGGDNQYWTALRNLMKADKPSAWSTASSSDIQGLFAEYLPNLFKAFGAANTLDALWAHTGPKNLTNIIRLAYPNGVPLSLKLGVFKAKIGRRIRNLAAAKKSKK